MIRFAHELSFVRLATTLAVERIRPRTAPLPPSFLEELEADDITDTARSRLKCLHDKLIKALAIQILTTSIAALPALTLYVAYTLIRHGLPERNQARAAESSVREIVLDRRLNQHLQRMEQQAIDTKELQDQEAATAACP
jgi:hypothetical protein